MDYADEEFIKGRNAAKKDQYSSLETGLFIKDRLVKFDDMRFFSEFLQIKLPSEFVDMPPNMARIKYPSESRPSVIKTSLDTSINFCFSLYPDALKNEQVKFVADHFQMMLAKINPANQFLNQGLEESGNLSIGWVEYKSFAVDDQLYNLVYFFPLGGKMCQGLFNCFYRDMQDWKPAAYLVMKSIVDLTNERGANDAGI